MRTLRTRRDQDFALRRHFGRSPRGELDVVVADYPHRPQYGLRCLGLRPPRPVLVERASTTAMFRSPCCIWRIKCVVALPRMSHLRPAMSLAAFLAEPIMGIDDLA